MLEQRLPGEPFEDALTDLVDRLDVECHPRHGSGRAEPDDHALEIGVAATHVDEVAAGRDELEPRHGGREVAVGIAGPMRCRGDRASDRDVRRGGQIGQGDAFARQRRREGAVRHTRAERDGARLVVDDDVRGQGVERDELWRVCDVGERVARAEHPDPRCPSDDPAQLVERGRPVQPRSAVGVVAAPVMHARRRAP